MTKNAPKTSMPQKIHALIDRYVIENISAKVLCLTLALALHFFYQIITLDHQAYTVPVTVKAEGIMLNAGPFPPTVRVVLDGKREDLAGVNDSDLKAILDISYFAKEGEQRVPVRVELATALAHLDPLGVKVIPDEVTLRLEHRKALQVPLNAQFQGQAASGFDVSRVTLMPSTVLVSGPRSVVEALGGLDTEAVPLDGRAASFTAQVGIVPPAGVVTMNDVDRNVRVTVAVILAERIVSQRYTVPLSPSRPEIRFAETPQDLILEFAGSQTALNRVRSADFQALIGCDSVTGPGRWTLPVTFVTPTGLTLVSRSTATVSVEVVE